MIEIVRKALQEAHAATTALLNNESMLEKIDQAASLMNASFAAGGRVFSCGNGGSHCDAMHFAEELTGRYRDNRRPFAALAISDPAHISCTANDYGFDQIFSRFIAAHGRKGDCLLAISTSGKSENIRKAAVQAQELGMNVISLTGKPGTPIGALATLDLCTPGGRYADRVQELHIKVIHILIELIELKDQTKRG